ncbi:hypothetical protein [Saccharopolyspora hattusasensis]|uniref:hypothetical protein n=1 Tax=Saccharopolyspora hattusasensis TaxID=1128679 RepID=UPI003D98D301
MSLMSMPDEYVHGKVDVSVFGRRIDDFDQRGIELLPARRDLSRQVQRTRKDVGGPRIEPVREAEITETYQPSFGDGGSAFAAALLRIYRG